MRGDQRSQFLEVDAFGMTMSILPLGDCRFIYPKVCGQMLACEPKTFPRVDEVLSESSGLRSWVVAQKFQDRRVVDNRGRRPPFFPMNNRRIINLKLAGDLFLSQAPLDSDGKYMFTKGFRI